MRERAIKFGDESNLVGVLIEPDAMKEQTNTPCVLMLNAGILHHVGPFRLYVDMARHLAAQGYLTCRFDIAGLGDSQSVKGAGYDKNRVVDEVRMVIDELQRSKEITDFVLLGLCTGADNAHGFICWI